MNDVNTYAHVLFFQASWDSFNYWNVHHISTIYCGFENEQHYTYLCSFHLPRVCNIIMELIDIPIIIVAIVINNSIVYFKVFFMIMRVFRYT